MFVLAVSFELHIPECHSLKQKRAVVKPIVEGLRRRYQVASAEVAHQNTWQRATIGVAIVAGSESHVRDVRDEVERFVWSFPEVQVLDVRSRWLEDVDL